MDLRRIQTCILKTHQQICAHSKPKFTKLDERFGSILCLIFVYYDNIFDGEGRIFTTVK